MRSPRSVQNKDLFEHHWWHWTQTVHCLTVRESLKESLEK